MTGRRVRMLPWDPLWRLRHVGYPVSPRGYRGLPAFASLSMAGSGGRAAAGQPRLLPLQRITDHATLYRGGALVRDETAAHRIRRAGEEVQARHAPSQQQAGAAGVCASAAEVIPAGGSRFTPRDAADRDCAVPWGGYPCTGC